ncbi:MAG: hypothetical protein CM1200mP10_15130 [Candidatus Neomarinimicrobiota bacterium]|nr:MAG: hypothetical protein CM1200mP10_15130 [Candidatus Neomarinimicrobiota bacterium]
MGQEKLFDCVWCNNWDWGRWRGLKLNRRIHHGRLFFAGEWGDQILYPNGRKCYCGEKGLVETYLSGPSLEKYWGELGGKPLSLEK